MGARGCKSGHRTGFKSGHRGGSNLDAGGSKVGALFIFNGLSSTGLSSTRTITNGDAAKVRHQPCDFFGASGKKIRKKKARKKTRTRDGLPERISTAQLQSPSELDALYRQYKGGVIRFDFFALACRAVTKGKNPPGLFRRLLADNATDHISAQDEDQARLMIHQLHQDGEPCELVKGIVDRLVTQFRVERPPSDASRRLEVDRQLAKLVAQEYAR